MPSRASSVPSPSSTSGLTSTSDASSSTNTVHSFFRRKLRRPGRESRLGSRWSQQSRVLSRRRRPRVDRSRSASPRRIVVHRHLDLDARLPCSRCRDSGGWLDRREWTRPRCRRRRDRRLGDLMVMPRILTASSSPRRNGRELDSTCLAASSGLDLCFDHDASTDARLPGARRPPVRPQRPLRPRACLANQLFTWCSIKSTTGSVPTTFPRQSPGRAPLGATRNQRASLPSRTRLADSGSIDERAATWAPSTRRWLGCDREPRVASGDVAVGTRSRRRSSRPPHARVIPTPVVSEHH